MKLTKSDLDALREVGNVGAGNASTALSEMTNKKIKVSFPSLKEYKIEKIPSLIGSPGDLVASVHLRIDGMIDRIVEMPVGHLLFIFKEKDAIKFANLIQKSNSKILREIDKDALKETGNILSGACLDALSQFLKFKMMESLPEISVDMLNSTMDSILANMASKAENALVFKTNFSIESHKLEAYFVLLFNPSIHPWIFSRLREIENQELGSEILTGKKTKKISKKKGGK